MTYSPCCEPFFAVRGTSAHVREGRNATGINDWFMIHFPVAFAGGLRAGAHLIAGQNMAHNNGIQEQDPCEHVLNY